MNFIEALLLGLIQGVTGVSAGQQFGTPDPFGTGFCD